MTEKKKTATPRKKQEEDAQAPEAEQEGPNLPKQIHPFIGVIETSRTYVYPRGEQIKFDNVYAVSIRPDGGHRLLTRNDPKRAFTVAPGWLTINHEVNAENVDGYVFTE